MDIFTGIIAFIDLIIDQYPGYVKHSYLLIIGNWKKKCLENLFIEFYLPICHGWSEEMHSSKEVEEYWKKSSFWMLDMNIWSAIYSYKVNQSRMLWCSFLNLLPLVQVGPFSDVIKPVVADLSSGNLSERRLHR